MFLFIYFKNQYISAVVGSYTFAVLSSQIEKLLNQSTHKPNLNQSEIFLMIL